MFSNSITVSICFGYFLPVTSPRSCGWSTCSKYSLIFPRIASIFFSLYLSSTTRGPFSRLEPDLQLMSQLACRICEFTFSRRFIRYSMMSVNNLLFSSTFLSILSSHRYSASPFFCLVDDFCCFNLCALWLGLLFRSLVQLACGMFICDSVILRGSLSSDSLLKGWLHRLDLSFLLNCRFAKGLVGTF